MAYGRRPPSFLSCSQRSSPGLSWCRLWCNWSCRSTLQATVCGCLRPRQGPCTRGLAGRTDRIGIGRGLRVPQEAARRARSGTGIRGGTRAEDYQSYLYAVCFVGVVVLLAAGPSALYGLARVITPGTTGFEVARDVERNRGMTQLVTSGLLAAAAFGIFAFHWRHAGRLRPGVEAASSPSEPATGSPA
jgi:hypothetical protein